MCHGSDLPEWWSPQDEALGANFTQAELDLSADMQHYYANFAASGSPGSGNPARPYTWPAYSVAAGRPTLNLETDDKGGKSVISANRGHWCDWWDTVPGYHIW